MKKKNKYRQLWIGVREMEKNDILLSKLAIPYSLKIEEP